MDKEEALLKVIVKMITWFFQVWVKILEQPDKSKMMKNSQEEIWERGHLENI